MRLGELIETLQDIYNEQGDIPVEIPTGQYMVNGFNVDLEHVGIVEDEGMKLLEVW